MTNKNIVETSPMNIFKKTMMIARAEKARRETLPDFRSESRAMEGLQLGFMYSTKGR
jgi:hypothetical protein